MGFRERFKEELEKQKELQKQQKELQKQQQEEAKKQQEQQAVEQKEIEEKASKIIISTGDIKRDYEIVSLVYNTIGIAGIQDVFSKNGQTEQDSQFRIAESNLKLLAANLKCDAIIYVKFNNNPNRLHSYGTAVRYV